MKLTLFFLTSLCFAAQLDPASEATLDRITAAGLRGNLSFLASDLLEGRDTPSRGLDLAAEYIAAQFRRAGLDPILQTANYAQVTADLTNFSLAIGGKTVTDRVDVQSTAAIDIADAPIYKVESAKVPSLAGKVAVLGIPDFRAQGSRENVATYQTWLSATIAQHPAAIVEYYEGTARRTAATRLIDLDAASSAAPVVILSTPHANELFDAKATISIHVAAPAIKPAKVSNVAAILKGSDPVLAGQYILVTAHYDHLGMKAEGPGDRIYNGANDDGSGTVSVIELANALAQANPHPKRSILFMTFFGEEKGLLGSHYYALHPLVPLAATIAQVNLEQVGRTDDKDGAQVGTATFTGFNFSNLPAIFEAAGKQTGIKVYNSGENGDSYFGRSDNQSLADAGIPAHTLCVAFDYPDYHGVADEWPKVDFDNMAKVDRMVALGLLKLADDPQPPHWNASDPKAEKYAAAWKTLHP